MNSIMNASWQVYPTTSLNHVLSFGQSKTLDTGTSKLPFNEEVDAFQKSLEPVKQKSVAARFISPFIGIFKWFKELLGGCAEFLKNILKVAK